MPVYEEKDKSKWTKDGRRFYYRCYYTDKYGKRKQKESGMYKSRPAAKKAEDDFLLSVATIDENDLDVMFETVYREWFLIKSRNIKKSTAYSIKTTVSNNVLEFFKGYKLHSIKTDSILMYYDWLDKKGHCENYNNKMIGYLQEILNYAHMNYEFDNKVLSKLVKRKSNEIRNIRNDAEWNYWTYNEFLTFINCIDDRTDFIMFNFLYFTGLRKGEMFALSWNDVDFNNKTLAINKQITNHIGSGSYEITSTKTKNSDSFIDLDDDLIKLLQEHYERETKFYGFNTSWFIFGNVKPISATTLARKLETYINVSNVKKITPHGFRHSHASLLIHLGCDEYEVAARLRDNVETVMKTYYHMFPEKKKSTINTLNDFKNNKNKG